LHATESCYQKMDRPPFILRGSEPRCGQRRGKYFYDRIHASRWPETHRGGPAGLSGRMNVREGKLLDVTGTVRYEVIGKRTVPREAETLHQQAREAGGHGDYEKAIALLEQASELAPDWPYPVYDRAYTHMLMNDCDAARRYYQKTLELSPRSRKYATITGCISRDWLSTCYLWVSLPPR